MCAPYAGRAGSYYRTMAELVVFVVLFVLMAAAVFTVPVIAFLAARAVARRWSRDGR